MDITATNSARNASQRFWLSTLPQVLNYTVLALSFGLIAFISFDTYKGRDYLEDNAYMVYQFVVCIVFLIEYIYRFIISPHKSRFLLLALPFLFISIPYLNIIEFFNIDASPEALRYICFIPIVRGLVALVMVVVYVTQNLTSTVCVAYILVLAPIVYMSGLIFYVAEKAVNPAIKDFWYAMWWACMNVTTIGCYINPKTSTGMWLAFILSLLGIIMFPLFTVYFGQLISMYSHKYKKHTSQ